MGTESICTAFQMYRFVLKRRQPREITQIICSQSYRELCFGRYTYFYLYPTCILLPAQCLSNQSLWITVLNRVSFFRVIHLKFYCGYWKSEREMDGDGFSVCHDGGSRKYWIYLKKVGSVYASSFISIKHGCHVFMYLKTAQFGPKATTTLKFRDFFLWNWK